MRFAQFVESLMSVDVDLEKMRNQARNKANESMDVIRNYKKIYSDDRFRKSSIYKKGDYVLIRNIRNVPSESAKLKSFYKGPYMIHKALRNNRYVIRDISGFNIKQRSLNTVLSADRTEKKMDQKYFRD